MKQTFQKDKKISKKINVKCLIPINICMVLFVRYRNMLNKVKVIEQDQNSDALKTKIC